MGIKCSLLGHSFDDATVEREREEQGSEVVITIRETETCARCGEERVVSENKEVTTLETPDDVGAEPAPPDEPEPDSEAVEEAEPVDDKTVPTVEHPESDEIPDEPPVTDDAEILDDDEEDEPEREPGQWPQDTDPETEADDEDFDQYGYVEDDPEDATVVEEDEDVEFIDENEPAEPTSEDDSADEAVVEDGTDAEFIDADEDGTDAEFIDADDDDDDDATSVDQPAAQTNAWPSEEEDADESGQPSGPGAVTVPDGKFVCGNCGFSTPVESSSLRAGDFCPECHKETLEQVRE